jgi:hypothetical protein
MPATAVPVKWGNAPEVRLLPRSSTVSRRKANVYGVQTSGEMSKIRAGFDGATVSLSGAREVIGVARAHPDA